MKLKNLILILSMFLIVLSINAFAAKDFIVENKTSALFIINGTTGNIILAPSFGLVGIGTINPINALTVIGSVSAFGSLNATFINATEIRIGNSLVPINGAFNNGNYTALEDAGFRIVNFTTQLNNYIPSFFNNENFTNLKPFTLTNYSAEYASTGFKIINFTNNYDNRADRFGNANYSSLAPFTLANYSSEYSSSGFKISNFTANYEAQAYFKIANYTALENAAFTNTNYSNLNNSLWNLSRNLFVYLKDAAYLVRIGDVNRNISNDTFAVIGSAAVYGSLNATTFNSSFILQNNNQVQTINAVFNNANYTALENAAFTNTNYTNLEAAAFNKANYSAEYASTGFKLANFTTAYDTRADRFGNANYTALENAAFTNTNYTNLEAAAFNKINYSAEYSSSGFKISNYTALEDAAFRIANFTTNYEAQAYFKIANYTALQNAAFTLANYSAEYASSGYKLANFTSNLNAQNSSLWNRSSTNTYLRFIDDLVGIGTITPDNRLTIRGSDADANLAGQPGLLHLNITDSYNKSTTNLITLDHNLNNPGNSTGGIGIGILFRAVNNDSELVNVSFINASLVNAINGSEASALSFYTRTSNGLLTPKLILNGSDVFIGANAATGGAITVLNSGNVGIGTTSPLNKLEVLGTANASAFLAAAGSVSAPSYSFGMDTNTGLFRNAPDNISIATGGATRMTIDNNGNIGIGTTAPIGGLHLQDTINLTLGSRASHSAIWQDTAVSDDLFISNERINAESDIIFRTSELQRVKIDGSGNVGINTSVPAQTLTVQGTLNVTPTAMGGNASLYVTPAGLVGIGTASPTHKLHVFEATNNLRANVRMDSSIGGNIRWASNSTDKWQLYSSGNDLLLYDSADRVTFQSGGNVGIGTTTPAYLLQVANVTAAVNLSGVLYINGSSGNVGIGTAGPAVQSAAGRKYLTISGSTGAGVLELISQQTDADNAVVGQVAFTDKNSVASDKRAALIYAIQSGTTANNRGGALIFNTKPDGSDGSERMRIDSTGNVGIGTTVPGTKLTVAGDANISGSLNVSSGLNVISGNVGIGTTNPQYALQVKAAGTSVGTLETVAVFGKSATNGGALQILVNDSLVDLRPTYLIGGINMGMSFTPTTSAGVQTEAMRITSTGNVGIGTTSPVAADSSARTFQIGNRFVLQNVVGTQAAYALNAHYDGAWKYIATETAQAIRLTNSGIYFAVAASGSAGNTITNWDTTDIRMIINANGNVGIGTTSPTEKLAVSGNLSTGARMVFTSDAVISRNTADGSDNALIQIGGGGNVGTDRGGYINLRGNEYSAGGDIQFYSGIGGGSGANITFWTDQSGGATEKMRITNTGNVGIGTTSPGSSSVTGLSFSYGPILQVHSSARPSPTFSGTGVDFRFVDTDAGTNNKAGDIAYDDQVFVFRSIDDAGNLKTGNVLVINTSSGNVGIGTTAPGAKLDVSGGVISVGAASIVNSNTGDIIVPKGRAYRASNNAGTASNRLIDAVSGTDDTGLYSGGTITMTLQSQNVGIGTTGPASLLHLAGNDATLIINDTSGSTGDSYSIANVDGSFRIIETTVGTRMTIDQSGNVGIGTTGPASTLTVVGNFSATGTKSAVVNTSYGIRKLYAIESPDIRFYDQGRASLTNGIANISLDPIFIETVEPDYQVFLTPEADTAGIYVAEKAKEYFIVKGRNKNSNIPFSWLISALRKGYSATRLDSERKENTEITAVIDEENKVTDVNIINNLNNIQNVNASGGNGKSETNAITGNAINEVTKSNNEKSANENKFAVASSKEDEIINKISEKTNLDKEQIKKSITFKRKVPEKQVGTESIEEPEQAQPQSMRGYSNVNGSVIIKLG